MKRTNFLVALFALSGLIGCAGGETLKTSYLDIGTTPTLTKARALEVLRSSTADAARQPCAVKDTGIVGYEGYAFPTSSRTLVPFNEWRYSAQASELRRGNDRTAGEGWHAVTLTTHASGTTYHCNAFWRSAPNGVEAGHPPEKSLQRVVGALRSLGVVGR